MSELKDVLMVSKPLAPPWQDSNKNLTKNIISYVNNVKFHVLTPKGYKFDKENVISEDIYQSTGDYAPALAQNLQAFFHLITKSRHIDLFHFFFTPNVKTSLILKHLFKIKKEPCIHTVTSTPKDLKDIDTLLFADRIITLSDYTQKKLQERDIENVLRIYPGLDLTEIDNFDPYALKFRRENNLMDSYIIMFAGDYEFSAANKTIIESIPPIVSKYPTAKFIFACRNKTERAKSIEDELKQYCIDLGIDKYVMFIGTADNMLEIIQSIDICIFPVKSLYAKMDIPLVLLECMAYAKPVIISDIAPLNEVMLEDIGFKVPVDDTDALVLRLFDLLHSNFLRMEKGFNGRKAVEKHFNMKVLASKYEEVYQEILNG